MLSQRRADTIEQGVAGSQDYNFVIHHFFFNDVNNDIDMTFNGNLLNVWKVKHGQMSFAANQHIAFSDKFKVFLGEIFFPLSNADNVN